MPTISLPNSWQPRGYQRQLWDYLETGGKRAVAVWHRRAGKDDVILHRTAVAAFERRANYWHLLPEASQARKAIWEAVNPHTGIRRIDEAFPVALREATRENEMAIRFKNGSSWQVVGSDNYNSLVGAAPAGVVFSEWALADPNAWAYIRPILRENGGWAVFIYTPRGRNHGATFFEAAKGDPAWFAEKLTAEQTGVFSTEQLAQELREYQREYGRDDGESRYRQEYLCDFNVAVVGAYYGRLMTEAEDQGRITSVIHDPALTVDTWWDLGYTDDTAIWFVQHAFNEIHVIDYWGASGATLDDIARMLRDKARPVKEGGRGFLYGKHLWPHDGGNKTQASKGRPLSGLMYDLGYTVQMQPKHDVQVGIQRVRQILPRCWFDREYCAIGIEALRNYQREWDDKNRVYKLNPLHNWSSHGADAFRTGAMTHHDPNGGRIAKRDRYAGESKSGSAWAA